jgi:hypothetical protein
MAFYIDVYGLPYFRNYEQAKKTHDSIKPIRGKYPEVRPLGKRRAQHKAIVERVENGVKYVACCLYGHEVVKFFADGRIVMSTCRWPTMSTAKFIGRVVYQLEYCGTFTNSELMVRVCDKRYLLDSDGVTINADGTVVAKPCVIHKVNRKNMNAVRKEYKQFIDYVVAMHKLTNGEVEFTTERAAVAAHQTGFRSLKCEQDLDVWVVWAARIMREATVTGYGRIQGTTIWDYIRSCKLSTVKARIAHHIKLNHPEVFERVELPLGEIQKDSNKKYIRSAA